MAKERKTLIYEDTPVGRKKMAKEIDLLGSEGWEIKSKDVAPQGYDAGSTCCLGCLFLPLALLGKKNNIITVILEREKVRTCPFCAETVVLEAIKCKHCGSVLPALPKIEEATKAEVKTENIVEKYSPIIKKIFLVIVLGYLAVVVISFIVGLVRIYFR